MTSTARRQRPVRRAQQGFTLLEVLIAVTLTGLIFVALFGGLRLAARSWEAGEARAAESSEQRLARDLVRRKLESAHHVAIGGKDSEREPSFMGTDRRIRFVAPLLPYSGVGGLHMMELLIEDRQQGQALVLRFRPYRPEVTWDEAMEGADTAELLSGINEAGFEYFGSPRASGSLRLLMTRFGMGEPIKRADRDKQEVAEWRKDWQEFSHWPWLVRLSARGSSASWPDLTVALSE